MGGRRAHEFMCFLDVGEDVVAVCDACGFAANRETLDGAGERCTRCGRHFTLRRGVEVGNIFQLGTRYTDALGVFVVDASGARRPVIMGSYGIGVSRLLACLVERFHDDRGIALTAATAPVDVHLLTFGRSREQLIVWAECIEREAVARRLDVLWDDRAGLTAGEQLADADLIGGTLRVTLGSSTVADGTAEIRERRTSVVHTVPVESVVGEICRIRERILSDEAPRASASMRRQSS
jgi:prolyl-tRNA synthetase